MSLVVVVKGHEVKWENNNHRTVEADVRLTASRAASVWLVDGGGHDDDSPFLMIVGAPTEHDAARAYALNREAYGKVPPVVFRVFPLASLEPFGLNGVVDGDGDEDWSAFQNAWIEVRL